MNYELNKGDLKDLLSELIRIPSVNPDGDPGTDAENTGEKNMALGVGHILASIGAEVSYDEVEKDRPNVIAKFSGNKNRPQILLAPHLDTVGCPSNSLWYFLELKKFLNFLSSIFTSEAIL